MRPAYPLDIEPIVERLLAMRVKNPNNHMRYTEESMVRASLAGAIAQGKAVMHNGFLILFDVGSPWYTTQKFLIEELILRVYDSDAHVSTAIQQLERLREEHGCVAIAAGDTQVGYMAQHYEAEGYRRIGYQYMKD